MDWIFTYSSWRDLWVPALVGGAGVVVAVAALVVSAQAKRLSEQQSRIEEERHIGERRIRYEERLDDAAADLIRTFTPRAEQILERRYARRDASAADTPVPNDELPPFDLGHAAASVIRLFARGDDAEVGKAISSVLLQIDSVSVDEAAGFLGDVHKAMRAWRLGDTEAAATARELDVLFKEVESRSIHR